MAGPAVHGGARVYLRTPSRRAYLARVIGPLADHLAADRAAQRVRVVTGWRFGPHFDLFADADPERQIDWHTTGRALAEGARRHPAAGGPEEPEQNYLRRAVLLGQIEGVPPPYLPRRPHGAVDLLPTDDGGRLSALRAAGLSLLRVPFIEAAATVHDGALLARVAEAFLALAASHPYGMRFGTFSLRSHAEAFLHWAAPDADYRALFEERLGKDRAVLEWLVRRMHDGVAGEPTARWADAFHNCLAEFTGEVTNDDLDALTPPSAGPTRRGDGPSPFHAAINASGVIDDPPAWFAAYRLTINLFYQLLPALDVSPLQRFYLCHAIAETVDAVFDETWQARLAALQVHMAGVP